MKVLFLVPYPSEGASNRIRVEQFIPYLESSGIKCRVRPFVNRPFYKVLYLKHKYLRKVFWFVLCSINRVLDIVRSLRYDIVFIHREAYPFGGAFIEAMLYRMGRPIIFDFDDSIFIPNTSEHNVYIDRFKKPGKIPRIISMSSEVIAGNDYLKDYALRFNKNVTVIPSSVDTARHMLLAKDANRSGVVIGWIGSNTTRHFLYELKDVFIELSKRYNGVTFEIVGTKAYGFKLPNLFSKDWSLETEAADVDSFDIGIMPMPENAWTKGKCAFKAILYMASGIPVVASPVGVNNHVVEDGINGFLAGNNADWLERLSRLIEDRPLREKMGDAGREKAEKLYSLEVNAPKLVEVIVKAANK